MRNLILGVAGAAVLALATPAVAQVHVEVPGVGVRVGDGHHRGHHIIVASSRPSGAR